MKLMYPSLVRDLPEQVYRAEPAISQSLLRQYKLAPTPLHFYKRNFAPDRPSNPPSAAMQLGTVVHSRLQLKDEGEFEKYHVKVPKGLRKTGEAGREFKKQSGNRILVSSPDWDLSLEMFKAVKRNKTAMKLLEDGIPEESFFFKHKGQNVKGRTDLRTKNGIVGDWKTTLNANPWGENYDSFKKSIIQGRLDWQAAFYRKKINDFIPDTSHDFVFIAIEKSYPFSCSLITLDEADMRRAEEQVFQCLDEVCERLKNKDFGNGYSEKIWKVKLGEIK